MKCQMKNVASGVVSSLMESISFDRNGKWTWSVANTERFCEIVQINAPPLKARLESSLPGTAKETQ